MYERRTCDSGGTTRSGRKRLDDDVITRAEQSSSVECFFFCFFLSTCNNGSYVHFFLFAIFKKTHFYKSSLMVERLASAGGSDISQQTGSFLFQSADD